MFSSCPSNSHTEGLLLNHRTPIGLSSTFPIAHIVAMASSPNQFLGHPQKFNWEDNLVQWWQDDATQTPQYILQKNPEYAHSRLHFGLTLSRELQRLCNDRKHGKAIELLLEMEDKGVFPSDSAYRSLLNNCANLHLVKEVQAHLSRRNLEYSYPLGEVLVVSLLKCGAIEDALQVFNALSFRSVFSWSAVICSYADRNDGIEALKMYRLMLEDGMQPNEYTYVSLFKACGSVPDVELGIQLHNDARNKGFDSNMFVSNTLISMYGKCGRITEAEDVFYGMSERNLVSWNAMMSAYVDENEANNALQLYDEMQDGGVNPNGRTLVLTLQACCLLAEDENAVLVNGKPMKLLALQAAYKKHTDIEMKGIEKDGFLYNSLMKVYSKCGAVAETQRLFSQLPLRDVVSWNTLLSAFVEHGRGEKALRLYRQMQEEAVKPDERTFVNVLQATCIYSEKEEIIVEEGKSLKLVSLSIGKALHADAKKKGFVSNIFIVNTLITLYGRCGSLLEAEDVFTGCNQPDIVSWTALLTAYLEQGEPQKSLLLYREMQQKRIIPDDRTLAVALQACCILVEKQEPDLETGPWKRICLEIGQALQDDAKKMGFMSDFFVKSSLLHLYGKCNCIAYSEDIFCQSFENGTVIWNVMLSAYNDQGEANKVLKLYHQMHEEKVTADERTFAIVLQSCCTIAEVEDAGHSKSVALEIGESLHGEILKRGFDYDPYISSVLVSLYGKCGAIEKAQNVFCTFLESNVMLWNSILLVYLEQDDGERTLQLYTEMNKAGVTPDKGTYMIVLQAVCSIAERETARLVQKRFVKIVALTIGKMLHVIIKERGFDSDTFIANTLLSMYGKCRSMTDAESVFMGLLNRHTVSWNAMLSAHIENGQAEKALSLFTEMQEKNISFDDITLGCVLQACSLTGKDDICRQIHFMIVSTGVDSNLMLATTLIHAYGACALTADSQSIFEKLTAPDVVAWSSLIAGYAREGKVSICLEMFEKMLEANIKPTGLTFLSVLLACSHGGLVDKGVRYFEFMYEQYGIRPELEHYVSMVDLLGRAGDFEKLEDIVSGMPVQPDPSFWIGLLSACQKHGNSRLGKLIFERARDIQASHPAAYILMSNMCAEPPD